MIYYFVISQPASLLDSIAKFAPAIAALFIAIPSIIISYKVYRASEANIHKNVALQERNSYLKNAREKLSEIICFGSDLHYNMLRYHNQMLRKKQFGANLNQIELEQQATSDLIDQFTAKFNSSYHSFLILLNPTDDPKQVLESQLTKLFDLLRNQHSIYDKSNEVIDLQREIFKIARNFGK